MAWNSYKLIFLCILVSFFNFATTTTKAQNPDKVYFVYQNCTANKTTKNSNYEKNLRTLFSSLSSNAATNTFYNDTVVGGNSSDTVYGMFMCRGDVLSQLCAHCVANATEKLSSDQECSLSKEVVIWYAECMVRYSNVAFFSTVDTSSEYALYNANDAVSSNSTRSFMNFLLNAMNQTAEEAANSGNKFSTKEANLSHSQSLYCLAQCTQDLTPQNCTICLTQAISRLESCCYAKEGVRVLFPSCNIWYELYPFYGVTNETTPKGLVPTDGSTASVMVAISPTKFLLFLIITYVVVF